ncbi:MAG TPA: hypothetical protein VKN99_18210 [Polyangia bacterium]|nr:hypothetical protein [Polyangia bacterium]
MLSRREFLVAGGASLCGAAVLAAHARALHAGPLPPAERPPPPLLAEAAPGPYEIVGSPFLLTSDARPLRECRTFEEAWHEVVHFRMPDHWRTRLYHGF